ncbi:MAG: magnesium transporter [Actinobacteria bacterium]|nr:magnesium transporter [Actinomycetota bacterium]
MSTVPRILHLSLVVGSRLIDSDGRRIGEVTDVLVSLGGEEYPPVTGIVARVAGREVFVPADALGDIEPGRIVLARPRIDLQPFQRRDNEVLLKHDLLDRQLINVDGARIVRANEIEIARVDGWWRVVGVDTGVRSLLRRLLPRTVAPHVQTPSFVDWASLEPFTGHIPTIRLRVGHPKLARLHPAELADLVEAAPRDHGEEIIASLHDDPEREADLFEELGDEHQLEFVEDRSDAEVAALLDRMEVDDAADLVAQLDEDRRASVLALVAPVQQRRLRTLLGYEPTTAGGLMSPEFVAVYLQATREETLERVRRSSAPGDAVAWVFVINARHRYRGAVSLPDLLRADDGAQVVELVSHTRSVAPDAGLGDIARLMTDYDLTVVPVLDDQERPLGVVTVDDLLEIVIPPAERRFGIFGSG